MLCRLRDPLRRHHQRRDEWQAHKPESALANLLARVNRGLTIGTVNMVLATAISSNAVNVALVIR